MDSRPPRPCYPRGNFSVTAGPHQWGHDGSLGPGFPPASPAMRLAVRPAFGLALSPGFLSRVSRPLRTRDSLSRACHPSQTAHQTLSPRRVSGFVNRGRCFMGASPGAKAPGSLLPPTLRTVGETATPGCGEAPRGLLAQPGGPRLFTGLWIRRAGGWDCGALVGPFMHAGTYPARHLATLRESQLLPPFGGA